MILGETARESINSVLPTYTAIIDEDLPPGSEFARVFANDSDVGLNGMVTYELMNHREKFRIDTFTGGLFTIGKLLVAEEQDMVYDMSVVASDRGRPALRSMAAVLMKIQAKLPPPTTPTPSVVQNQNEKVEKEVAREKLSITNGRQQQEVEVKQEQKELLTTEIQLVEKAEMRTTTSRPVSTKTDVATVAPTTTPVVRDLFTENSINLEIFENIRTPSKILDLKSLLSNPREENVLFDLGGQNFGIFEIDQLAGHLVITTSPDREQRDKYALKIKAVKTPQVSEREVPVFFYTLYVQENQDALIAEDELTIHVNILDLNDNRPEFLTNENPVEISVSSYLEAGELIAKMEAWDSDLGDNADLRYKLVYPSSGNTAKQIFAIDEISGDIVLRSPLINQVGKTFRLGVEAKDNKGSLDGLTGSIQLIIYVLDNSYQLTMVLSNGVDTVTQDLDNITRTLSSIMGYNIGVHHVEQHRGEPMTSSASELVTSSENDDVTGTTEGTDIYIFAVDAQKLVKTDEMIKVLSTQLQQAKSKLAHHGLLEVRAGAQTLAPLPNGQDQGHQSTGSLGSLEIAVLGMACAVFLGALVAVISIFCLRCKKRQSGKSSGYPAPLAIPLPSYNVEQPASSMLQRATVGILHNPFSQDPRRLSTKSNVKYFDRQRGSLPPVPKQVNIDTSEETSDTNVDDHLDGSPDSGHHPETTFMTCHPPVPSVSRSVRNGGTPKSSKRQVWPGPTSASAGSDRRRGRSEKTEKNNNAKSSRDSGIDERRGESLSLTCSNCHQSTGGSSCESCESEDQGIIEPPMNIHHIHHHNSHHQRQGSCGSAKFRRHKSASPSRRSGRQDSKHKYERAGGGERGHSQPKHQEPRSKSAGHLTNQCHCHCNCESERRSRSRSNCCQQAAVAAAAVPNQCDVCCMEQESGPASAATVGFSRYGKGSQSTRSTQWEVYRDVGDRSRSSSQRKKKQQSNKDEFNPSPFQMNIPPMAANRDHCDEDSDEMELRMATTTANKAHSWRGDHPMKNSSGHFHMMVVNPNNHNNPNQAAAAAAAAANHAAVKYNKSKSYNPYKHNLHFPAAAAAPHPPPHPLHLQQQQQQPAPPGGPKSYHFGQSHNFVKPGLSSNPLRSLPPPPTAHHGAIRLVGLAPPQPHHH